MRRIRTVGLCLVAVFAFSALALTSTASAGTYKWCRSQKHGPYTESRCRTHAMPNKGKYILNPVEPCVPTKKGAYLNSTCTVKAKPHAGHYEKTTLRGFTSTSGESRLFSPSLGSGQFRCRASTDVGEITGPKTDVDRITFTGCEFEGLECESIGPDSTPSHAPGVIITNLLHSKLFDNPEKLPLTTWEPQIEPAIGEVWNELESAEHYPYIDEFNCDGEYGEVVVAARVLGWIAGAYTSASVNMMTKTTSIEFGLVPAGRQGLLIEVNVEGAWEPPGGVPSLFEMEEKLVTESEIEVAS
jgi:hypothetical protein